MTTTKTIPLAPVHKVLSVNAAQAKAFDVFINGLDRWWPKAHSLGAAPLTKSVIEPFVGGRWHTSHEDGSTMVVGRMTAWEPPHRIVFTWDINAQWKCDPSVASEVEVRFIAEGPKTTRVELEHRKFEALGPDGGQSMRDQLNGGWPGILDLFKSEAEI